MGEYDAPKSSFSPSRRWKTVPPQGLALRAPESTESVQLAPPRNAQAPLNFQAKGRKIHLVRLHAVDVGSGNATARHREEPTAQVDAASRRPDAANRGFLSRDGLERGRKPEKEGQQEPPSRSKQGEAEPLGRVHCPRWRPCTRHSPCCAADLASVCRPTRPHQPHETLAPYSRLTLREQRHEAFPGPAHQRWTG